MLKYLTIILITLTTFSAFAGEGERCSSWTKQTGVSCLFASSGADLYARQCENPCKVSAYGQGNMGPNCDQEEVCHFQNPETFLGVCSDWVKNGGANCYDPKSQSYEQEWVRACTVGLRTSWCSRVKPF